jgi:hypothetical protein
VSDEWLYEALRGELPSALSSDVLVALPNPALVEVGARSVVSGREPAAAALRLDASRYRSRTALLRCENGDDVVIEFAEDAGSAAGHSSVVAVRRNAQSIQRVLGFRHKLVDPAPARQALARTSTAAVEAVLRRYLDNLEAGRAAEAAECFAEGAIYSFPPRAGSTERGVVVGKQAIKDAFTARGINDARHHVSEVAASADGNDFAVSGRVIGLPNEMTATFLSCVAMSNDGLIQRYVAVMCVPELPI